MSINRRAWVTLATNDTYSLGALVLAHSLIKVHTQHDLVVLITSNVTEPMRGTLQSVFHEVKEVNILDSGDAENLRLLARPELGITFTKLHCWRLTQYEKCVFLDADTLVLQNCDDLFEREELSAAPDVGWPDCFNSGVFVFKPSEETYTSIIDFALANGSFDGGDQGLLNMYFSNWATADSSKRLPFLYNLSSAAIYSYLPAFKWYGKGVKIVHFIGTSKPWQQSFNSVSRTVSAATECAHLTNFYQYWWNLFCAVVHPQLSSDMTRRLYAHYWLAPLRPRDAQFIYAHPPSRNNSEKHHAFTEASDGTSEASVICPEHYAFTDPWEEFEKISSQGYNISNVSRSTHQDTNLNEGGHSNHCSGQDVTVNGLGLHEVDTDGEGDNFCHECVDVDQKSSSSSSPSSSTLLKRIDTLENVIFSNALLPRPVYPSYSEPENTPPVTPIAFAAENECSTDRTEASAAVNTGVAQSLSQMKLEEPTPEQLAEQDLERRKNWEQGNIDYLGRDSFDNIWSKISQSISADATAAPAQQPEDEGIAPVSSSQSAEGQPAPVVQSAPPLEPVPAPASEPVPAQTCSPVATVDSAAAVVSPPTVTPDTCPASAAPQETAVDSAAVTSLPETVPAPIEPVITPQLAICPMKATPTTQTSPETAEAPAESPITAPSIESQPESEAPAQPAEEN